MRISGIGWIGNLLAAALLLPGTLVGAEPPPPPGDETAGRIVGVALVESRAYETVAWLTDRIGHRLSGSRGLEQAVEWTAAEMRRSGLDRVWTEKVMVPHWVRGHARARIVSPASHQLSLLALGGSVATPKGGLRAEVVEVGSFEELEEVADRVEGKIVLFNREMRRNGGAEHGYGPAARLRGGGPVRAAQHGAVGMLIRSLGTADYRLPHTGATRYQDGIPKIPAAAISVEDALLIQRLLEAGERVTVELDLGCKTLPDAESANVLADLRGRERPDEVVVIACHLDSWDVGTGAIDDGAGCAIVIESLRLLKKHDLVPRRTIRGVLFTNEENGLRGGRDYAARHEADLGRHVAAIESDAGAGTPLGFTVSAGEGGEEMVRRIASHLAIIGANQVTSPGGGADISRLKPFGVPLLGLRQDTTYYFDYHHTEADTLDKIDPDDLKRNVAAMMLMAYALADMELPLPRLPIEPEQK
jgi:hypothetical protein